MLYSLQLKFFCFCTGAQEYLHRLVYLKDDHVLQENLNAHVACLRVNGASWNGKDFVDVYSSNGHILTQMNVPAQLSGVSYTEYGLSVFSLHNTAWEVAEKKELDQILQDANPNSFSYIKNRNPKFNMLHHNSKGFSKKFALCFKIARQDLETHLQRSGKWALSNIPTGRSHNHYSIFPTVDIPITANDLVSTTIMSASYYHIPELKDLQWQQCELVLVAAADIFLEDGLDDFGKEVISALDKPGESVYNHEDVLDQILNYRVFTLLKMPLLVDDNLASYLQELVSGM